MVRKKDLKFIGKIFIIILVIPISVLFGIWWTQTFPLVGGAEILSVNIIYQNHQENYNGELADCAEKTFDGIALSVLFYNLSYNRTYYLIDGRNQSHIITCFTERDTFRLWITGNKGDEFFLADQNKRDLIWIQIRQTED